MTLHYDIAAMRLTYLLPQILLSSPSLFQNVLESAGSNLSRESKQKIEIRSKLPNQDSAEIQCFVVYSDTSPFCSYMHLHTRTHSGIFFSVGACA